MANAPDSIFVTGPDFEQLDDTQILVTPAGRPQTTLAQALADASGSVTVIRVKGGPILIENTITTVGTVEAVGSLAAHGVLIGANADPITATAAMGNATLLVGQTAADPVPRTVGGDVTMDNMGDFALVASGVTAGTYGDATHVGQFQVDAAGRLLVAANVAITGAPASVLNIGTTGVSGGTTTRVLYDNAGTLGEYAVSGTGNVVLSTSPTLVTPALGTPSAAVLTNATGLPLSTGVTGILAVSHLGTTYTDGQLLIGSTAGGTLAPATLTQGTNITITNSGGGITIAATGGGSGSVTSVIAQGGPFLANGTITTAGTITGSVTTLTNHGVLVGQGASAPAATAVGTDGQVFLGQSAADPAWGTMSGDAAITNAGVLNLTSIVAGATVGSASLIPVITYDTKGRITATTTASVPVTAAGVGAVLNSGTVSINNSTTLTGTAAGTVTIAPTTGTSDVLVNMPASGGAVTFAASPAFIDQRCNLSIKQGATAATMTLNSGFVFYTSGAPTSFTLSATANARDNLMLWTPDGTNWAVMAIAQGLTI